MILKDLTEAVEKGEGEVAKKLWNTYDIGFETDSIDNNSPGRTPFWVTMMHLTNNERGVTTL